MSISVSQHTPEFCTAGQLQPEDMAALAAHGIRTVINNRPDGEGGPDRNLQASGFLELLARTAVGSFFRALRAVSSRRVWDWRR